MNDANNNRETTASVGITVIISLPEITEEMLQKVFKLKVVRKPVFGVSDQVPHKTGCTTTQDG